jgi:hypothetical protein
MQFDDTLLQEVDLKKAMFFQLGTLRMESNKENDYTARQLQSVEITQAARPCAVSFVKLVLQKNYQNRKNQYNQVGAECGAGEHGVICRLVSTVST